MPMKRHLPSASAAAAAAALLLAHPATAQTVGTDAAGFGPAEGSLLDSRASGEFQANLGDLRLQRETEVGKNCFKYGCLIIVNQSRAYDVIGLYLAAKPKPGEAAPAWGANLLGTTPLQPMKATWTVKSGDATMCGLPVHAIMRQRKDKKNLVTIDGTVDLCPSPHQDAILRLDVTQ